MENADTTELVATLNRLLEAERAGTRLALATRRDTTNPVLAAFMSDLEKDEARWCGMLKAAVEKLGATASDACGDFFDKAMAISDPIERLAFLNRGQAWVVRKIDALTPQVSDETLRAALSDMLANHNENIAATDALIARLRA